MRINPLQQEVQVFCIWKDWLIEQEEQRRQGKHLGFQSEDAAQGGPGAGADKLGPGLNAKSKAIKKGEKKLGGKGLEVSAFIDN